MVRKNAKGEIEYLMRSGMDMVRDTACESNIRRIIDQAETKEITEDYPGFPICVNGKFYFPKLPPLPEPKPQQKPKRKR